jgi:hypothetical protein
MVHDWSSEPAKVAFLSAHFAARTDIYTTLRDNLNAGTIPYR